MIIHSEHIEKPVKTFKVKFWRPRYFNVFWHPAETRITDVLAETPEGALKIAKYHYYSGSNFELIGT